MRLEHQHTVPLDSYLLRDFQPADAVLRIARGDVRLNAPATKDAKLYHFTTSTCSQRVRLAAAEKGVSYKSEMLDFAGYQNLEPDYLAINPRGVVPTWADGTFVVFDSPTIIRFIDAYYEGPPLRPKAEGARADVERMIDLGDRFPNRYLTYFQQYEIAGHTLDGLDIKAWVEGLCARAAALSTDDERLAPIYRAKIADWEKFFAELQDAALMERIVAHAEGMLDTLEERLQRSEFLCGDAYTLADTCWTTSLLRLESYHGRGVRRWFGEGERPYLEAYAERLKRRPSFREAYVAYFEKLADLIDENTPPALRETFLRVSNMYAAYA
ncbi:MAG: glutathione S-transferase family protein [Pseudomonadota bacterium]